MVITSSHVKKGAIIIIGIIITGIVLPLIVNQMQKKIDAIEEKQEIISTEPPTEMHLEIAETSEAMIEETALPQIIPTEESTEVTSSPETIPPDYTTGITVLKTAFDADGVEILTDDSRSFKMKGKTYTTGVIFSKTDDLLGYGANDLFMGFSCQVSVNVEDINILHFRIGHVDNQNGTSCKLGIFLDGGNASDVIDLSSNMRIMDYTLDVSDAQSVQFIRNFDLGGGVYALTDFYAE